MLGTETFFTVKGVDDKCNQIVACCICKKIKTKEENTCKWVHYASYIYELHELLNHMDTKYDGKKTVIINIENCDNCRGHEIQKKLYKLFKQKDKNVCIFICEKCKSIAYIDDNEKIRQVELHISVLLKIITGKEILFSHTYCPKCMNTMLTTVDTGESSKNNN
jgi:hypothetical protein